MTMNVKLVSLSAAALMTMGLLGGCTDQTARDAAAEAKATADAAQACCEANEERINRMYQKIMSK